MKSNKEVTIYDVARALHISPSTVSRGLKDHPHIRKETRSRIKALAHEMGYQAVRILIDHMNGALSGPLQVLLRPELNIRRSTGPAKEPKALN